MGDIGFMPAPESWNERKRNRDAQQYLKMKHWENELKLHQFSKQNRATMKVDGLGISLIKRSKVVIKYEKRLNLREIPRSVLIDSHCILSNSPLVLLDASQDWRTRKNPLVCGSPYIKFYCGVNLKGRGNEIIGVLSIFDIYPRSEFPQESIDTLTQFALEIMDFLHTPYEATEENYSKRRKNGMNADAEINLLAKKLGRATSRGNNLTLFERDGSGSA